MIFDYWFGVTKNDDGKWELVSIRTFDSYTEAKKAKRQLEMKLNEI